MSLYKRCSKGVLAAATMVAVAGCSFNEDFAEARDYRIDKKALDNYMTDAPVQTQPVVAFNGATAADSGPQTGIFGHWVAKIDMEAEIAKEKAKNGTPTDPSQKAAAEMGEAMVKAMGAMMNFDLVINQDGTFALTMMMMPVEGHWTQNGDKISLNPEKMMGMTMEEFSKKEGASVKTKEPLILQILPDGKGLKAIDPKHEMGTQEDLVFVRA